MSMKKLLCVTLVLVMLIGILPVGLIASAAEEIVLNKDSAEYSEVQGLFLDDPFKMDENDNVTRYSLSKDAKISYKLDVPAAGNYEVMYYNAASGFNHAQQTVTVKSDNGEANVKLFLKTITGWRNLGVYKFTPGSDAEIIIAKEESGGCIRSGAIKLIPTDKDVAVAPSAKDPSIIATKNLSGYVITSLDEGYSEGPGAQYHVSGLNDAKGNTSRFSADAAASMIYTPDIIEAGEHHVFYFVIAHSSNGSEKVTVNYSGGSKSFDLNTEQHIGWVYLGKFPFELGTGGNVTVQFNKGFIRSGGARFVGVNDATVIPEAYATPENPGGGTGEVEAPGLVLNTPKPTKAPLAAAPETNTDEYLIIPQSDGYAEHGTSFYFHSSTQATALACNGKPAREISTIGDNSFRYTPDLKEAGEYEVFYYVVNGSDGASKQAVSINTADGEKLVYANHKEQKGWISLGKYNFNKGTSGFVETPISSTGITRAGGVCFVGKNNTTFNPTGETTTPAPTTAPTPAPTPAPTKAPENSAPAGDEYIMTGDSPEYSQVGNESLFLDGSGLMDVLGKPSKYLTASTKDDYMLFTPNLKEAGEYEVFYYVLPHASNSDKQKITITYDGGTEVVTVDCKTESGWVSLGKFKFKAGTEGSVALMGGCGGMTRSGGIKFVK